MSLNLTFSMEWRGLLSRPTSPTSSTLGKIKDQGLWRSNLSVCRVTQMPAILLEMGFLMIPEVEEMLLKPKFHRLVADSIVTAIRNFMSKSQ